MKKLWRKFKHWLIKKLGGYVERTHLVRHYTVTPVTAETMLLDIPRDKYHNDPEFQEYIDRILAGKLADYIYDRRMYLVDICESCPKPSGPFEEVRIDLKATIKVLPTEKGIQHENS